MKMKNRFFIWIIPVIWAACSLIHFNFPGDEYYLYAFASIAGSWIVFIISFGDIHNPVVPISIALTGAIIMLGIGFLMDKTKI